MHSEGKDMTRKHNILVIRAQKRTWRNKYKCTKRTILTQVRKICHEIPCKISVRSDGYIESYD
jgi:hypothetical protein